MDDFIQTLSEEQKQSLLKALSGGDSVEEQASDEPNVGEDFVVKTANTVPNLKRIPVKAGTNTWSDTGEHKDVVTPDTSRTPRNRKTPNKKTVICNACGRKEKIQASLVYGEYYRCSRCVGK
jgi:hypothetical protein